MPLIARWVIEENRGSLSEPSWDTAGSVVGPRNREAAIQKARETIPGIELTSAVRAILWDEATEEQQEAAAYEDEITGRVFGGALGRTPLPGEPAAWRMASPDNRTRRQRQLTTRGLILAAVVIVGLSLLLVLFRPTSFTLALSLLLATVGAYAGFSEARSRRLEMVPPPSQSAPPFRRLLPGLILIGAVLSAVLHMDWIVAIGDVLFFFAGVLVGIGLSFAMESTKPPSFDR